METLKITPGLKGWLIYRPNRVTEELVEKLTKIYKEIAPTSNKDEADIMIIERKLASLLENRELIREPRTGDDYNWALAAEFAICIGLPSRLKILFPYKNLAEQTLDGPLAVYINGDFWQSEVKELFKKIIKILNELKIFV